MSRTIFFPVDMYMYFFLDSKDREAGVLQFVGSQRVRHD